MTTHFWGPIANWGLAASGMCAVCRPFRGVARGKGLQACRFASLLLPWGVFGIRYDAALKGPEIINERMSATQARLQAERLS